MGPNRGQPTTGSEEEEAVDTLKNYPEKEEEKAKNFPGLQVPVNEGELSTDKHAIFISSY